MAMNNLLTKFRGRNDLPARRAEWEPFRGFQSEMNRLFDDFFGDFPLEPGWYGGADQAVAFSPEVDLSETDKDIIVKVELPGMDKKDVSVELDDDVIVISGEKKEEHEDKNRRWHVREQSFGTFRRQIPLPSAVKDEKAKAAFRNGILTVTVPKDKEAEPQRKMIDITTE
ncbi:MAG: Hsp20/alpha crystallin family protein [Kiritimatiellia bacterium]